MTKALSGTPRYDAVLLLGFGGPTQPKEIRPFLDRVLQGRPIPASRYEDVVRHYVRIGGRSPYNELTQRQCEALAAELAQRGIDLPVKVGLRNTAPFVADVMRELSGTGARRLLAIALAAHRSAVSWDRYVQSAEEARAALGPAAPEIDYVPPFFDHPLFVRAQAARVREALEGLGRTTIGDAALIFTAHSIPQAVADESPYVEQVRRSAELVAQLVAAPRWRLAYQSRSGSPAERWLEPDVRAVLRDLPERLGAREALVVPIGFLCDNVEVLYDLDVDAARVARASGVRMQRAAAINDHPLFIEMLANLVAERVHGVPATPAEAPRS